MENFTKLTEKQLKKLGFKIDDRTELVAWFSRTAAHVQSATPPVSSPHARTTDQLLLGASNAKTKPVVIVHCSLSAVTHAPFHVSVLRPASQVGRMHDAAGIGEVS